MTDEQKYLFDLNGYLVVENAISPEDVALANEAIDRHRDRVKLRDDSLADSSPALVGTQPRGELWGLQSLEEPYGPLFRRLLTPPTLVPILHEILGKGFRLDHDMFLLSMEKGAEGFYFHGKAGPKLDLNEFYLHHNGQIFCGLTVVSIQLTDVNAGDGGFALVPGSHKANFTAPRSLLRYEAHRENVRHIPCGAGSAVIFTEAITHGTLPWTSDRPRRTLLTRYTRGNMSYLKPRPTPAWMTEREKPLFEPPYQQERFGRPVLPE